MAKTAAKPLRRLRRRKNERKISGKDYTLISSMLFGMFFGAGNLIFPLILGAKAGKDMPLALLGMLVSAVGFPLLGIISMGISKARDFSTWREGCQRALPIFFTCALYLTIGPLFAIPAAEPPPLRWALRPFRVSTGLFFN